MEASNDAELIAMLKPAVQQALMIVGEDYMKPTMEAHVTLVTGRGDYYDYSGGAGSLAQAWTTNPIGDGVDFMYDSSLLSYDDIIGRHTTPIGAGQHYEMSGNSERVEDMASLIDLGLGGNLFGRGNPTQSATHFWDAFLDDWESNKRNWVIAGLEAVGLPVVYKGFA